MLGLAPGYPREHRTTTSRRSAMVSAVCRVVHGAKASAVTTEPAVRTATEPVGTTTSDAVVWRRRSLFGQHPAHRWSEIVGQFVAGDPGARPSARRYVAVLDVSLWAHDHDATLRKAAQSVAAEAEKIHAIEDEKVRTEREKRSSEISVEENHGPPVVFAVEKLTYEAAHHRMGDGDQHARVQSTSPGPVHSPMFVPPDVTDIR